MSIVVCHKCGAKNRVSEEAAGRLRPVCGRCSTALEGQTAGGAGDRHPIEVTDATFSRDVLQAGDKPVLLDCWAPWCGPCRLIAPVMQELAAEAQGRFVVGKLNTDENPRTASQFQIDAIPTLLIFKSGKLVERLTGLRPKQQIQQALAGHL